MNSKRTRLGVYVYHSNLGSEAVHLKNAFYSVRIFVHPTGRKAMALEFYASVVNLRHSIYCLLACHLTAFHHRLHA
jgi:hypothetical protein